MLCRAFPGRKNGIPWSTCPHGGAGAPGAVTWGRPRERPSRGRAGAGIGTGIRNGVGIRIRNGIGLRGRGESGRSRSRGSPRCGRRRSAVPAVPAIPSVCPGYPGCLSRRCGGTTEQEQQEDQDQEEHQDQDQDQVSGRGLGGSGCFRGAPPGSEAAAAPVASLRSLAPAPSRREQGF